MASTINSAIRVSISCLRPVQFRYFHIHIGEQDIVCACQTIHQLFNLAVHMSKLCLQGGDFGIIVYEADQTVSYNEQPCRIDVQINLYHRRAITAICNGTRL